MSNNKPTPKVLDDGERAKAEIVRKGADLPAEKWDDAKISSAWRMVPDNARPNHMIRFLKLAETYNLDPFLGEIWLAPTSEGLQPLVGRDAFIRVAERNEDYNGFDSGVVYEEDTFRIEKSGGDVTVTHNIAGFDRGDLVGAYCVAYREGRKPQVITREWEEFKHLHSKKNWEQYGPDMIETRCIVAALRRLFPIRGLYTESEFADEKSTVAANKTAETKAEISEQIDQKFEQMEEEKAAESDDEGFPDDDGAVEADEPDVPAGPETDGDGGDEADTGDETDADEGERDYSDEPTTRTIKRSLQAKIDDATVSELWGQVQAGRLDPVVVYWKESNGKDRKTLKEKIWNQYEVAPPKGGGTLMDSSRWYDKFTAAIESYDLNRDAFVDFLFTHFAIGDQDEEPSTFRIPVEIVAALFADWERVVERFKQWRHTGTEWDGALDELDLPGKYKRESAGAGDENGSSGAESGGNGDEGDDRPANPDLEAGTVPPDVTED